MSFTRLWNAVFLCLCIGVSFSKELWQRCPLAAARFQTIRRHATRCHTPLATALPATCCPLSLPRHLPPHQAPPRLPLPGHIANVFAEGITSADVTGLGVTSADVTGLGVTSGDVTQKWYVYRFRRFLVRVPILVVFGTCTDFGGFWYVYRFLAT